VVGGIVVNGLPIPTGVPPVEEVYHSQLPPQLAEILAAVLVAHTEAVVAVGDAKAAPTVTVTGVRGEAHEPLL